MSYLDGGGRLLVMGQNVAAATDNNPDPDPVFGRSTLYRAYLGSHYLQDNVFIPNDAPDETVAVTGLVGTLLQGMLLDLGGSARVPGTRRVLTNWRPVELQRVMPWSGQSQRPQGAVWSKRAMLH